MTELERLQAEHLERMLAESKPLNPYSKALQEPVLKGVPPPPRDEQGVE